MNQTYNASPVRIATRGSKLALWQARYVASQIEAKGYRTELQIIKTQGDRVQDRFLHEMGGKGLFVRELEQSMLEGKTDIAVHSLKDLPAVTPNPFCLAAILSRHDHRDAIIFSQKSKGRTLFNKGGLLRPEDASKLRGMTIATSSLRRQALLKSLDETINLVPVRGNVDTRLRKLEEQGWDALILAAASLERLEINDVHSVFIDSDWFIPCAAQGALAIECLETAPIRPLISSLSNSRTYAAASLERAILAELGGDCTMPFGALVQGDDQKTDIRAIVLAYDGRAARFAWQCQQPPEQLDIQDSVAKTIAGLQTQGLKTILHALETESADLGTL